MFGLADGPRRVVLPDAVRGCHDRFGRALGHEKRRLAAALNHHAEHPPVEVVRQLGKLPVRCQVGRLGRAGQDGGVQRVLEARLEVAVQVRQLEGAGSLPGVVLVDTDGLHQLELAQGQSARLVRAKNRHAAQVLDCRQALDQDAVGRERASAAGQVEGDDGRQQLGRQSDCEGDGEEQRVI